MRADDENYCLVRHDEARDFWTLCVPGGASKLNSFLWRAGEQPTRILAWPTHEVPPSGSVASRAFFPVAFVHSTLVHSLAFFLVDYTTTYSVRQSGVITGRSTITTDGHGLPFLIGQNPHHTMAFDLHTVP